MKINSVNLEEWIVAYLDGELKQDELVLFQSYLHAHPHVQDALDRYDMVKFEAEEEIIFLDKQILFKKEGFTTSFSRWWPRVAAVLLLLSAFPFFYNYFNISATKVKSLAVNTTNQKNTILQDVQDRVKEVEASARSRARSAKAQVMIAKPQQPSPVLVLRTRLSQKSSDNPPLQENKPEKGRVGKVKEMIDLFPISAPLFDHNKDTVAFVSKVEMEHPILIKHQINTEIHGEKIPLTDLNKPNPIPILTVTIDEHNAPKLFQSLNHLAIKAENTIERIKELKEHTYTLNLGNKKIVTLNN